jgi:parallel beta-helix repeat protein/predicted outer membrane repeat protein
MRGKANLKKWIWCGLILLLATCTAAADKIIYVDDDAAGANNGSSWTDAYNYLQDALAAALQGDEIRVAQGVYKPDLGGGNTQGDRGATFQLINGVIIKGSYAGPSASSGQALGGTDPNVVDINLYESFLSGDLNGDDVGRWLPERVINITPRSDNSCHIVTGNNVDETAVLNGFTIIGGFCISNDCNDEPRGGAAIRIESGSPQILNCLITNNRAFAGSAVLNNDSNSTFVGCIFSQNDVFTNGDMENIASSPVVTNCTFESSSIGIGRGTGMENYNDSSPIVTGCIFRDNYSGVENYTGSKPVLTNCTFENNSYRGMENWTGSSPTLINCTFENNGYGLWNYSDCNVLLIDCKFKNNTQYGIENSHDNTLTLTHCTFENNKRGGINSRGCNLTLNDCLFSGNKGFIGAGIDCFLDDLVLYNCKFIGNVAQAAGGGICSTDSNIRLYNCIFSGNTAYNGGAIHSTGGTVEISAGGQLTLHNCIINNNSADDMCGGILTYKCNVTLYNCTLSDNSASSGGGGIYNSENISNIILTNCILWGNTPDQIKGSAIVSYSNVQGGFPGEGNIDVDPLFANPDNGDYHLKSQAGRWDPVSQAWIQDDVTSLCIDAGDPRSAWFAEPEPNGGRINMGAYGGTPEASLSFVAN